MADKPRPIIPVTPPVANNQSQLRGTLVPPRPIIPVGVAAKKPSILKAWFAGLIENIPYNKADQGLDDIEGQLSRYVPQGLGYDIRRNLTIVAGDSTVSPTTVRSDTFNPVYKRIAGVLSSPAGDRNLRDLSPSEAVSDNSVLSAYYEMVKRRSAIFLSRGQTSQMTDALFAEKLYGQLEGIESTFGSSGSLKQGFMLVGEQVDSQGKKSVVQMDPFEQVNLIFSTGRPKPQALGDTFDLARGGGIYADLRYQATTPFAYASQKNLPGFQNSPGALRYLTTAYNSQRFNDFHVTRHEIGHHIHAEIERLHYLSRKRDISTSGSNLFTSNYKVRAEEIADNLAYVYPSMRIRTQSQRNYSPERIQW